MYGDMYKNRKSEKKIGKTFSSTHFCYTVGSYLIFFWLRNINTYICKYLFSPCYTHPFNASYMYLYRTSNEMCTDGTIMSQRLCHSDLVILCTQNRTIPYYYFTLEMRYIVDVFHVCHIQIHSCVVRVTLK